MSRAQACFLGLFFAVFTLVVFNVAPQIMSIGAALFSLGMSALTTIGFIIIAIRAED